ncbi:Rieske 2Fe-2S domain-containing protein [Altererythrobacter sp.]|uniref:Rieske 2Fe-2S domain-containing protein n=1 Tax=Altererythrobacter sp. TaxID=1872480 RepID=UPI003D06545C
MRFVNNTWYCAGWSGELGDTPFGRTYNDKPIVFYRDESGAPVALGGACPHRFAPLAQGRVTGDRIVCPYHGLEFDRSGACVHNPHGTGAIPPNARVETYPVIEKNGAIWLWLGDPAEADPSLLSDTDWLLSPDYAVITGYLKVNANYQLVTDNLLDLTHAPFLHPDTLGGRPEDSFGDRMHHDFRMEDGNVIHSDYHVSPMPRPTPQMMPLWGDRPSLFSSKMTWRPTARMELDINLRNTDPASDEEIHVPSLHYLAPETQTSTHYFFAMGRNVKIDDSEQTEIMARFARIAFEQEDEPMIRQVQEMMGTTDLFSLRPAILETDIAAVQARRIVEKMRKREVRA